MAHEVFDRKDIQANWDKIKRLKLDIKRIVVMHAGFDQVDNIDMQQALYNFDTSFGIKAPVDYETRIPESGLIFEANDCCDHCGEEEDCRCDNG